MNAPLNYTVAQVKPILDRFLAHLSKLSPAEKLALHDKGSKAFAITIEDKYKLVIFGYGIVLYRDGVEIHHSKTEITWFSATLRKSYRY